MPESLEDWHLKQGRFLYLEGGALFYIPKFGRCGDIDFYGRKSNEKEMEQRRGDFCSGNGHPCGRASLWL